MPKDTLRWLASIVMMVLVNLGIMIPAASGGLRPYKAAGVLAGGTFQVNETLVATSELAAHSLQDLLIFPSGINTPPLAAERSSGLAARFIPLIMGLGISLGLRVRISMMQIQGDPREEIE